MGKVIKRNIGRLRNVNMDRDHLKDTKWEVNKNIDEE